MWEAVCVDKLVDRREDILVARDVGECSRSVLLNPGRSISMSCRDPTAMRLTKGESPLPLQADWQHFVFPLLHCQTRR